MLMAFWWEGGTLAQLRFMKLFQLELEQLSSMPLLWAPNTRNIERYETHGSGHKSSIAISHGLSDNTTDTADQHSKAFCTAHFHALASAESAPSCDQGFDIQPFPPECRGGARILESGGSFPHIATNHAQFD